MAELSDVESVLVSVITQLVYPNGTAASSITGQPCRVYRGWPIPVNLDADLKAGVTNISVFPLDQEQNVTRYSTEWMELPAPSVKLTMQVSDGLVIIGGKPTCPLNAAVLVNGRAFVHPLQANDTPTSIATALAALMGSPASSNGPVVSVPNATKLAARIGTVGTVVQEVRRQKKAFRITLWCNSPQQRDATAKAVDPALASLTFINLPDGSAGRIRYERSHSEDGAQKALLYRRDLVYSVEYGTTNARKAADVVSEIINVSGGPDTDGPAIETINV